PVAAWLVVPRGRRGPVPCVVQYLGYGSGRGLVFERLTWAAAGYAHLVMDNRGQGAGLGSRGDTADVSSSAGPHAVGYSTRGILDPEEFYFRRLYTTACSPWTPPVRTPRSTAAGSSWPAAAWAAARRSPS